MISWLCGRMSAGKGWPWRAGSSTQRELICGVSERAGEPAVDTVGRARDAARLRALLRAIARRRVGHRVDGQLLRRCNDRALEVRLPRAVEGIPDGDRYAEIALARHAPVDVQV